MRILRAYKANLNNNLISHVIRLSAIIIPPFHCLPSPDTSVTNATFLGTAGLPAAANRRDFPLVFWVCQTTRIFIGMPHSLASTGKNQIILSADTVCCLGENFPLDYRRGPKPFVGPISSG